MADNTAFGLPLQKSVPDGWLVADVVVVAKVLDSEGRTKVVATCTDTCTTVEALGMVELARHILRQGLGSGE
jgi:hypothetical protein